MNGHTKPTSVFQIIQISIELEAVVYLIVFSLDTEYI